MSVFSYWNGRSDAVEKRVAGCSHLSGEILMYDESRLRIEGSKMNRRNGMAWKTVAYKSQAPDILCDQPKVSQQDR